MTEIKDYKRLKEMGIKIPTMIDIDIKKERILKEFIDGDTIYELILQDKMKSVYLDQLY